MPPTYTIRAVLISSSISEGGLGSISNLRFLFSFGSVVDFHTPDGIYRPVIWAGSLAVVCHDKVILQWW
jgi:hypothetical protein